MGTTLNAPAPSQAGSPATADRWRRWGTAVGLVCLPISGVSAGFAAQAESPSTPTWAGEVASILHTHCAACHHPDGPAPFSLLTYEEARRRARQIAEVTMGRYMPPWLPQSGYGPPLAGERRLEAATIETLRRWSLTRAEAGDLKRAPAPPSFVGGWQLGEPDLVVEMAAPYRLAADGPDVFRNFVMPVPVRERRFVRAVEIRPGSPRLVHHAVLMVDPTSSSRRQDQKKSGIGFGGMVSYTNATSPDGQFLGWTPGTVPFTSPPDMAWRLEPGADLVLQLHLLPSGREETVRARVGLYTTDVAPSRRLLMLRLGSKTLDIPAGEPAYRVEDRFTLPVSVELFGVYPHAHYLCTRMQAWAELADGSRLPLLRIDDWDFNWQDQYRYVEPVPLPAGSTLVMSYLYDNSAANPRNPQLPPRRVGYGPSSLDEMGDLWLQLLPGDEEESVELAEVLRVRELRSRIAGFRHLLTREPDRLETRFNLGSALIELGDFAAGGVELRRVLEVDPDHPAAHTNLGNALFAGGAVGDALPHFRRAAELEPERPESHYNLAGGLLAVAKLEEALAAYDRALELAPDYAEAHLNRGLVLARLGRPRAEAAAYRRATELRPDYVAAHYNLGHVLLRQGRSEEALASLERAAELAPDSARVELARADALVHLGRTVAALAAYRRVLGLEPQNRAAQQAVRRLQPK